MKTDITCEGFLTILASREPVPGGGGASAFAGALGVALGNMVGDLTLGKKKYADVQDDIEALNRTAEELRLKLIHLIQKDADAFEPLSKAYGLTQETSEEQEYKAKVMEQALIKACEVPLEIMKTICKSIDLHIEYSLKGTAIAISDVGCGAIICKSALMAASLNVFINTKFMKDREYAERANAEAEEMLEDYCKKAESIYCNVLKKLR